MVYGNIFPKREFIIAPTPCQGKSNIKKCAIGQGVSKIKILWYNKGYEKENGRGMEKMPEMRKD